MYLLIISPTPESFKRVRNLSIFSLSLTSSSKEGTKNIFPVLKRHNNTSLDKRYCSKRDDFLRFHLFYIIKRSCHSPFRFSNSPQYNHVYVCHQSGFSTLLSKQVADGSLSLSLAVLFMVYILYCICQNSFVGKGV